MAENIQLTYDERQRLKTCSSTDYIWQYASNPDLQIQMLLGERISAGGDPAGPGIVEIAAAMIVRTAARDGAS